MGRRRFARSARLRPAAEARAAGFDGEAVLLDLASGVYFGLDGVGAQVWRLIEERASVGEMRDAILAKYDVGPARCDADLQALLRDLVARGLAEIDDGVSDSAK